MQSSNKYTTHCMVPCCKNTTKSAPNKTFFPVPKGIRIRKLWCKSIGRDRAYPNTSLYCCEDHFDLEKDTINYKKHKNKRKKGIHANLHLKEGITPRLLPATKRNVQVEPITGNKSGDNMDICETQQIGLYTIVTTIWTIGEAKLEPVKEIVMNKERSNISEYLEKSQGVCSVGCDIHSNYEVKVELPEDPTTIDVQAQPLEEPTRIDVKVETLEEPTAIKVKIEPSEEPTESVEREVKYSCDAQTVESYEAAHNIYSYIEVKEEALIEPFLGVESNKINTKPTDQTQDQSCNYVEKPTFNYKVKVEPLTESFVSGKGDSFKDPQKVNSRPSKVMNKSKKMYCDKAIQVNIKPYSRSVGVNVSIRKATRNMSTSPIPFYE